MAGLVRALLSWLLKGYLEEADRNDISGYIINGLELKNLKLTAESLFYFGFPYEVTFSQIGRALLNISYGNLFLMRGAPVTLTLEDVFIVVKPINYAESEEEFQQTLKQIIRDQIKGDLKKTKGETMSKSLGTRWIYRVKEYMMKNLQIEVKNLQVCYEDEAGGRPFTCKLLVEMVRMRTTSSSWQDATASAADQVLYKMVDVEGMSLYIDCNMEVCDPNVESETEDTDATVHPSQTPQQTCRDKCAMKTEACVLPPASCKMNLALSWIPSPKHQRMYTDIMFDALELQLSKEQYAVILQLLWSMDGTQLRKRLFDTEYQALFGESENPSSTDDTNSQGGSCQSDVHLLSSEERERIERIIVYFEPPGYPKDYSKEYVGQEFMMMAERLSVTLRGQGCNKLKTSITSAMVKYKSRPLDQGYSAEVEGLSLSSSLVSEGCETFSIIKQKSVATGHNKGLQLIYEVNPPQQSFEVNMEVYLQPSVFTYHQTVLDLVCSMLILPEAYTEEQPDQFNSSDRKGYNITCGLEEQKIIFPSTFSTEPLPRLTLDMKKVTVSPSNGVSEEDMSMIWPHVSSHLQFFNTHCLEVSGLSFSLQHVKDGFMVEDLVIPAIDVNLMSTQFSLYELKTSRSLYKLDMPELNLLLSDSHHVSGLYAWYKSFIERIGEKNKTLRALTTIGVLQLCTRLEDQCWMPIDLQGAKDEEENDADAGDEHRSIPDTAVICKVGEIALRLGNHIQDQPTRISTAVYHGEDECNINDHNSAQNNINQLDTDQYGLRQIRNYLHRCDDQLNQHSEHMSKQVRSTHSGDDTEPHGGDRMLTQNKSPNDAETGHPGDSQYVVLAVRGIRVKMCSGLSVSEAGICFKDVLYKDHHGCSCELISPKTENSVIVVHHMQTGLGSFPLLSSDVSFEEPGDPGVNINVDARMILSMTDTVNHLISDIQETGTMDNEMFVDDEDVWEIQNIPGSRWQDTDNTDSQDTEVGLPPPYVDQILHLDTCLIHLMFNDVTPEQAPLLRIDCSFQGNLKNWSAQMTGAFSIDLEVWYFNAGLYAWEPLLEPVPTPDKQFRPWRACCLLEVAPAYRMSTNLKKRENKELRSKRSSRFVRGQNRRDKEDSVDLSMECYHMNHCDSKGNLEATDGLRLFKDPMESRETGVYDVPEILKVDFKTTDAWVEERTNHSGGGQGLDDVDVKITIENQTCDDAENEKYATETENGHLEKEHNSVSQIVPVSDKFSDKGAVTEDKGGTLGETSPTKDPDLKGFTNLKYGDTGGVGLESSGSSMASNISKDPSVKHDLQRLYDENNLGTGPHIQAKGNVKAPQYLETVVDHYASETAIHRTNTSAVPDLAENRITSTERISPMKNPPRESSSTRLLDGPEKFESQKVAVETAECTFVKGDTYKGDIIERYAENLVQKILTDLMKSNKSGRPETERALNNNQLFHTGGVNEDATDYVHKIDLGGSSSEEVHFFTSDEEEEEEDNLPTAHSTEAQGTEEFCTISELLADVDDVDSSFREKESLFIIPEKESDEELLFHDAAPRKEPVNPHGEKLWEDDPRLDHKTMCTYITLVSHDQLLLNITPTMLDSLTKINYSLTARGQAEKQTAVPVPSQQESKSDPAAVDDSEINLHNLLPIDIRIFHENADVVIPPGHMTKLGTDYSDGTSKQVRVLVKGYQGVDWLGSLAVSSNQRKEFSAVTMRPKSGPASNKHLYISIHRTGISRQDMLLYCPHWIVNSTGLPLVIKDAKRSKQKLLYDVTVSDEILLYKYKDKKKKKTLIGLTVAGRDDLLLSPGVSLDAVGSAVHVPVKDKHGAIKYQILLKSQMSELQLTKVVTLLPYHVVINKTKYNVEFSDSVREAWTLVTPGQSQPFWPPSDTSGKLIVRVNNQVSPCFFFDKPNFTALQARNLLPMCVDVQSGYDTGVSIVVKRYETGSAPVRIKNQCCHLDLTLFQRSGIKKHHLDPGQSLLYTWEDPTMKHCLMCEPTNISQFSEQLDFSCDGSGQLEFYYKEEVPEEERKGPETYIAMITVLADGREYLTVHWVCFMGGVQRTLVLTDNETLASQAEQKLLGGESTTLMLSTSLHGGMAVSVMNQYSQEVALVSFLSAPAIWEVCDGNSWHVPTDKYQAVLEQWWKEGRLQQDQHGELMANFRDICDDIDNRLTSGPARRTPSESPSLQLLYKQSTHAQYFHVQVYKLQVDNQLPERGFNIVLHRGSPSRLPFIDLVLLVKSNGRKDATVVRHCSALVQDFHLNINAGFVGAIMDLFPSQTEPADKQSQISGALALAAAGLGTMTTGKVTKQSSQVYFEYLHLGPVQAIVSFSLDGATNNISLSQGDSVSAFIESLGTTMTRIRGAQLCLDYFGREGHMMSSQELWDDGYEHYRSQVIRQAYIFVLGLSALGDPAGFMKGLVGGISDLFYQPIVGTVYEVETLPSNLEKGANSFLKGTVGGLAGSLSKLTGTVGNLIALLSLDRAHQKWRARGQHQSRTVGRTFGYAGATFVQGFIDGLSGPLLQPIRGAKTGKRDILKGLGKGLIGLFTKPVGGIVDSISIVFEGLRRVADRDGKTYYPQRLPRPLIPGVALKPYEEAEAPGYHVFNQLRHYQRADGEYYWNYGLIKDGTRESIIMLTTRRVLVVEVRGLWKEWKVTKHIDLSDITNTESTEGELCVKLLEGDDLRVTGNDEDILQYVQEEIKSAKAFLDQQLHRASTTDYEARA